MPTIATRSPALAGALRDAPNVVSPAHSRGAAATESSSSGTITRPLALAIITGIAAVMLDARIFLVLAMNEVAPTASRAVPARAGQEPNPDPLIHRPTLDPLTQRVDPADHLMAGYTRPGDRERAGDRPGVAVTDPTSLDTDADIAWRRFAQRLCREFKLSRRDRLDRTVGGGVVGHQNSLLLWQLA